MSRIISSVDPTSRSCALSFRIAGYDWSLPVPITPDKDKTSAVDLEKQGHSGQDKGASKPLDMSSITKQFDKESRKVCQMMLTLSVHSTSYMLDVHTNTSSPSSPLSSSGKEGKESGGSVGGGGSPGGTHGKADKEKDKEKDKDGGKNSNPMVAEITVFSKAALVDLTGLKLKVMLLTWCYPGNAILWLLSYHPANPYPTFL